MDRKKIDNLDFIGEYTIDDLGLESLCYELRHLAEGQNAEIFIVKDRRVKNV